MVVADVAWKRPALDIAPQRLERRPGRDVAQDDTALRAEECLVGRAGDDVGAFLQRLLEVPAHQAEDMRAVI